MANKYVTTVNAITAPANSPKAQSVIQETTIDQMLDVMDSLLNHTHTVAGPTTYTAISAGYDSVPACDNAGLWVDGKQIINTDRSYHIYLFDSSGNITSSTTYDVHDATNNPGGDVMASFMNNVPLGTAYLITTEDEPQQHWLDNGLPNAFIRFGINYTTKQWLGSTKYSGAYYNMAHRGAYMLMGNVGTPAVFESVTGGGSVAYISVSFQIINNTFTNITRLI